MRSTRWVAGLLVVVGCGAGPEGSQLAAPVGADQAGGPTDAADGSPAADLAGAEDLAPADEPAEDSAQAPEAVDQEDAPAADLEPDAPEEATADGEPDEGPDVLDDVADLPPPPPPECVTNLDCPVPEDFCKTAVCSGGKCLTGPAQEGQACTTTLACAFQPQCKAGQCQPKGSLELGPVTLPSPGQDTFGALAVLPGQGYVLAGTRSVGAQVFVLVVRVDLSGQVQWEQGLVLGGTPKVTGLVQGPEGLLVVGSAYVYPTWQGFVVLLSPDGKVLWSKMPTPAGGAGGGTLLHAVAPRPGGGWLVAGSAKADTAGWAEALSAQGDGVATFLASEAAKTRFHAAVVLEDGGWLLAGEVTATGAPCDAYVARTDALGKPLWQQSWKTPGWNRFHVGTLLPGGDVLLGGTYREVHQDAWVLRLTPDGKTVFSHHDVSLGEQERVAGLALDVTANVAYATVVSALDPEDPVGLDTSVWQVGFGGEVKKVGMDWGTWPAIARQGQLTVRAGQDQTGMHLRRYLAFGTTVSANSCQPDPCAAQLCTPPAPCAPDPIATEGIVCGVGKACQAGVCKAVTK